MTSWSGLLSENLLFNGLNPSFHFNRTDSALSSDIPRLDHSSSAMLQDQRTDNGALYSGLVRAGLLDLII